MKISQWKFLTGVATLGLGLWTYSRWRRESESQLKKTRSSAPSDRRWDEVDQASWESFPASDPPGRY